MNKNKFIRMYLWLSIVCVLVLAYLQYQFIQDFIGTEVALYGSINAGLFKYSFENAFLEITAFNIPLIMYFAFALLTGFVAVLALREEPVKNKLIQEVVVYNGIISLILIVSSIVFMILIPDTINGALQNKFLMTNFETQRDVFKNAFNFTYLFLAVYIVLNVTVLQLTKEKKFKEKKEEVELDSEFLL